ncbi:MAG: nicotianamine synthase family protein [Clostridia bacterium]
MSFQFVNITQNIESLASKLQAMRSIMLSYYMPIVKKEVELAKIKPSHNVLCVGGGYLPCTAMLISEISGATVTVIDNDLQAVESSTKLIKKLNLDKKVIVKHVDGVNIESMDFDVIHIAMQISPKEKVFKEIYSKAHDGAEILVRTPKDHLERGYQPFKEICTARDFVKQPSFSNIGKTLLYVR